IRRPRGLRVSRETQAAEWPSRARPTAVFNSAPPTNTSRLRACSRRRKFGGLSRTIASPSVMTSCAMLAPLSKNTPTRASPGRLIHPARLVQPLLFREGFQVLGDGVVEGEVQVHEPD